MRTAYIGFAVLGCALSVGCGRTSPSAQPPATQASPEAAADSGPMPSGPASLADWPKGAQLFEGLGDFHRPIATTLPEAQRYFDQGMRFLWAFNHDESTRSFARAAELDPACAMCFWGVALTVGPNYNVPVMAETRARVAWDALTKAQHLATNAQPVEKALIDALGMRYRGPTALDPSNEGPVLAGYANAMRAVAHQYPQDLDVQALFAESAMNVNAWKLWDSSGKPAAGTEEIVATLESVMKRDPHHPGANHYYIHAVESSPHPERGLEAATRLGPMMPAAGHLVHMPAHILQRVGRYEDAAQANRAASAADAAYLAKTQPLDYYPMYVAHNYSFLAYATAMEGRKAETLAATQKLWEAFPASTMLMMPGTDWYGAERYLAYVRFGLWDQMLAEPAPNEKLQALTGGYLFGRTLALAAKGQVTQAKESLAALERLASTVAPDAGAGLNLTKDVLSVAVTIGQARIASSEKRSDDAARLLEEAVAKEDALSYDEPADWFFPVRHLLGAELLTSHQPAQAERVFREDLTRNPENGWALKGLSQALRAQGKTAEAKALDDRFARAWHEADITVESSAL
jgi:tetratricopeptide (TPR) repeat protein